MGGREAGVAQWVWSKPGLYSLGQPGLHTDFLSPKPKTKTQNQKYSKNLIRIIDVLLNNNKKMLTM